MSNDLTRCCACDRLTNDAVPCELCAEDGATENSFCHDCRFVCEDCSADVCFDHVTKKQCDRCQYQEGLSRGEAWAGGYEGET